MADHVTIPEEVFGRIIERLGTLEAMADVLVMAPGGLATRTDVALRWGVYSGCTELRELLAKEGRPA